MKKTKVFFCGITSANIVQDAERDMTKANPPNVGGDRRSEVFNVTMDNTEISNDRDFVGLYDDVDNVQVRKSSYRNTTIYLIPYPAEKMIGLGKI